MAWKKQKILTNQRKKKLELAVMRHDINENSILIVEITEKICVLHTNQVLVWFQAFEKMHVYVIFACYLRLGTGYVILLKFKMLYIHI